MSKYQALASAIETFQHGGVSEHGANTHIVYSTTEVNGNSIRALLGRNVKSSPIAPLIWGCMILVAVTVILVILVPGYSGAAFGSMFIPVWVAFIAYRTTLIAVGADGLVFYCIDPKLNSTYTVFDSFTMPYDQIANVKVKYGKINTRFTFEIIKVGSKLKLSTSVPNKKNNIDEQADNLKCMLDALKEKQISFI